MPQFPAAGGPNSGPGLNPAQIWVSPSGNDNNDGLSSSASVKTGYVGYQKLVSAGGGFLYIAHETHWGGPVDGGGLWIRGDGLAVPGYLADTQCQIIGVGPGSSNSFTRPGIVTLYAGDNRAAAKREKPGVHITRTEKTIILQNIQVLPLPANNDGLPGCVASYRVGWDYIRKENGTIDSVPIHTAQRTGTTANGSTVFNVDLLPAVTVSSAQRTSNITLLTIPRPAGNVKSPPWKGNTKIWVAFTDVNFTSGSYTVIATSAAVDDDANWSIQIADVGSNTGVISSPGTVRSIYARAQDVIEIHSTNAQFPSTAYQVTATSIVNASTGTITVIDVYGGYNGVTNNAGPTSDIGTLLFQGRYYNAVSGTKFINCTGQRTGSLSAYTRYAPMYDFGLNLAFPYEVIQSNMDGLFPTVASGAPYDTLNMCGCLVQGEADSGFVGRQIRGHGAQIVATAGFFDLDDVVFDAPDQSGECPGAYLVVGSSGAVVKLNNIDVADATAGFGMALNRVGDGVPRENITGNAIPGTLSAAGQFFGSKLVANGGFGTSSSNAKSVGVGSGQLTLTGSGTVYLPIYATDATTIIGWIACLQATVNP